jgi:hypothetical protein
MSVESSVSKVAFTGNNSTVTPYNVPFRIDNATDLVVVARLTATGVETTLAGGQFTVSGLGNPAGCTVTTAAAWPNTYTLTFYREVPATQLTTYASNDSFPAASHERALDKLTYLVQQALRKLGQCFRVTEASTTPTEKPSIPLSVLGLDGSGQLVFRSSQEMVSFLSLTAPLVDNPVATWADPAERAVKVPDFLGQLGLERSTLKVYHSTGVAAGNWVASQADPADSSVTTAKILTQAVTNGKLAHVAQGILKGRASAGTGDVQDISLGDALNFASVSTPTTSNRFFRPLCFNQLGQPVQYALQGAGVWTYPSILAVNGDLGLHERADIFYQQGYSTTGQITFTSSITLGDSAPSGGTLIGTTGVITVRRSSNFSLTPSVSVTFTIPIQVSAACVVIGYVYRNILSGTGVASDMVFTFPHTMTAANQRALISFQFEDTAFSSMTSEAATATYELLLGSTTGSITVGGASGSLLGGRQRTSISVIVRTR